MLIAVLIGIMISIVVGVSLVPVIVGTSSNLTYVVGSSTVAAPTGLQALVSVLPYIFVAVILLGAVAWIGGQGG